MSSRERPADRGTRLGRQALDRLGREIRGARRDRGLSLDLVAAAAGISNAEQSRLERGLAPKISLTTLTRSAAIVGLDLVVRTYAGPAPIRDVAHAALLADFRATIHPALRWATEVPLPAARDQRAWDAMILSRGWRFGVEAETSPTDAQALARRLSLKLRDGDVDGVLLVMRDSRGTREFAAAARDVLNGLFPLSSRTALASLRRGEAPAGNSMLFIRRDSRRSLTSQV